MTRTSVEFRDIESSLATTLNNVADSLPDGHVSVRYLLSTVGEHSMLFMCIILTIPFLTPLPLPGVSTIFGLLIMLIAMGIIFNRVPWLPGAIPFIPLSNMLPGYGILFLAIGMLQHDGMMILLGYLITLLTLLYFIAIAVGVVLAGQSLSVLFTEPGMILISLPW
jgi:hypothetical protein